MTLYKHYVLEVIIRFSGFFSLIFSKKSKLSSGITENRQKMQLVEYKMSKS